MIYKVFQSTFFLNIPKYISFCLNVNINNAIVGMIFQITERLILLKYQFARRGSKNNFIGLLK